LFAVPIALGRLDALPVLQHFARRRDFLVAEDVRVTPDELVADRRDDIVRPERALFAAELRLKHDLEQKIPELAAELLAIAAVDPVDDLARLLEDISAKRGEILLAVPRAAVGGEQTLHELDQAREGLTGLIGEGGRFNGSEGTRHGRGCNADAP